MDEPKVWNRHRKSYVHSTLEKSAFIVFAEFCSDMVIDTSESGTLVKHKWQLKPSLFHLKDEVALDMARAMAIEPDLWAQARGVDLLLGRPAKRVFVGVLRYCPLCLVRGHHSTLFQLPQVSHCCLHAQALRMGCPHCGRPIQTSAQSIARNHLYCGACNRNVATERRRMAVGAPIGHPSAERFAVLRQVIAQQPEPGETTSVLRWERQPGEIAANAILVRVHHAHTVWGDPLIGPGFLKKKTEAFRLDVEGEIPNRPKFHALVRSAVITAFEGLAVQLNKYVRLKELPEGVEEAMHSAARVDLRVSVLAAAFWQSAAAFNVHRFVLGELPPPAAKAPPYAAWLPEHLGAMRHLVQRQVQAMFVRNLLRIRSLRYGAQVAWSELPEEAVFQPPWRLRPVPQHGELELQMRTRVDATTVERLASRYRKLWLLEAPEDVSMLDLVMSTQTPGAASLSGQTQVDSAACRASG